MSFQKSNPSLLNIVSLRIQYKCGKIRTRKTPNTDAFYAVILSEKCQEDKKSKSRKSWKMVDFEREKQGGEEYWPEAVKCS